ncbi:MAG: helix-turn-helix transcriptional regulator [Pseudomonadota bacterium]
MRQDKLKSVSVNNRKKQISVVYGSKKKITFHFGQVGIKGRIRKAWIDHETRGRSIGFEFSDGRTDFMPFDQPLALAKDPEFLLQTHIEVLTATIKGTLKKRNISKRYLAERLGTSSNQVHRLLSPAILNKNLEQLYKIAGVLGLPLEIRFRNAA